MKPGVKLHSHSLMATVTMILLAVNAALYYDNGAIPFTLYRIANAVCVLVLVLLSARSALTYLQVTHAPWRAFGQLLIAALINFVVILVLYFFGIAPDLLDVRIAYVGVLAGTYAILLYNRYETE